MPTDLAHAAPSPRPDDIHQPDIPSAAPGWLALPPTRLVPAGRQARARLSSKPHRRFQLYLLLVLGDQLALLLGYFLAAEFGSSPHTHAQLGAMLLVLLPMHLANGFQFGAYGISVLQGWSSGLRRILAALGVAALTMVVIALAWDLGAPHSRLFFALGTSLAAILLVAARYSVHRLGTRLLPGGPIETVVLTEETAAVGRTPYRIVDTRMLGLAADLNCPQSLDRLSRAIGDADRVIVACSAEYRHRMVEALQGSGVEVEIFLPEFEALGVLEVGQRDGRLSGCVVKGPMSLRARAVKRAFDLAIVFLLLPAALLTLVIVAILIKCDDGGPIFFVQKRIGRGNRFFDVYKFRTMATGALDHAGAQSTMRGDPRITRIGALLRRTSIDELPQLINVLIGSMSIVGPRPHALGSTAEDQLFWTVDRRYWLRHAAKPGLTGLAQVRGFRGATDSRAALINRIQADLEYLAGWTLWRDVRIVAATVKVVTHPNAY